MSHKRLQTAAQRVMAGDDSIAAVSKLERVVREDYPDDERLDDLDEALALYSPGEGPLHVDIQTLRQTIEDTLVRLNAADA